jgi:hypothetical protein
MHVKGFNPRYLAECTGESYRLFLYRHQGRRSADYCGNSGLLTRKTKQLLEVRHLAIWFVRIRRVSWRHVLFRCGFGHLFVYQVHQSNRH